MKTLFFLLLWSLFAFNAIAQYRAAGPWLVTYLPTREKIIDDFTGRYHSTDYPMDTARYFAREGWPSFTDYFQEQPVADTATTIWLRRKLNRAPWNVSPGLITLFINCKNPLIAPPTLRGKTSIWLVATGATLTLDPKQHILWLVPSAPTVILWAYQGQKLVFRHEFKAVPPPLPIIQCYIGSGMPDDAEPGYAYEKECSISLRAIPNDDFRDIMLNDARYRVAQCRSTVIRQGKEVAHQLVSGQSLVVKDLLPGDQIRIDILQAQRQNFHLDVINVAVEKQFVIPFSPKE